MERFHGVRRDRAEDAGRGPRLRRRAHHDSPWRCRTRGASSTIVRGLSDADRPGEGFGSASRGLPIRGSGSCFDGKRGSCRCHRAHRTGGMAPPARALSSLIRQPRGIPSRNAPSPIRGRILPCNARDIRIARALVGSDSGSPIDDLVNAHASRCREARTLTFCSSAKRTIPEQPRGQSIYYALRHPVVLR